MLSNTRQPPYHSLTNKERLEIPEEKNRQLYLSSIRGADEWSYKEFESYIDYMLKANQNYITVALPYHFGVKNRYINKDIVEQEFRNNRESISLIKAEFLAIPERGNDDSFFKYEILDRARNNVKALYAMSDNEYITYRNRRNEWKFYVEKLPDEIRILSMDVALLESAQNDNTSFWITRLVPDGNQYKKIIAYGESMHGLNSIIQMKRAKQLFYELECDYFVLDTQGVNKSAPLYSDI